MNVVDVLPAVTTADDGTTALELPLDRFTSVPPVAAGPSRVTVPVAFAPPTTADGEIETALTVAGLRMRVAV
jgi:hypothetical protein